MTAANQSYTDAEHESVWQTILQSAKQNHRTLICNTIYIIHQ